MPAIDPVILQLRAEVRDYENKLRSTTVLVSQQLDRQERRFLDLEHEVNRSTTRVSAAVGNMGRSFTGFVSGFAIGTVVRELTQLADRAKQLDAQLRLSSAGFGSFGQAQKDVERIAKETRSGVEATSSLYGNFARASKETGRSQADAARATETFAKVLKIGGADAASAASATLQFGQALASGTLRGDEFNSIMEASPRIARLLADSLGVPIGQLRKMAEEGKITTDVLFRALNDTKYTAGIDAEFKQLPVTFGDAVQEIENEALKAFGEFDKGGQFSNALVAFLRTGTDTFDGIASSARQAGIDTRAAFDGLANLFDPLKANATSVLDFLGIRIVSLKDQIAGILGTYDQVRNFGIGIDRAVQRLDNLNPFDRDAPLPAYSNKRGAFLDGFRRSQAAGRQRAQAEALDANFGGLAGLQRFVSDPSKYTVFGSAKPGAIPKPTSSTPDKKKGRKSNAAANAAAKSAEDLARYLRNFSVNASDFDVPTRADREAADERTSERIFGTEGRDYTLPTASVADNDRARAAYYDALDDAERQAQDVRERNVYQLANTFETLFQEGTDGVWQNFKDQGLRTIALIAAQALVASFSKGGGGLGSLIGNLGSAATSAFGGGKIFGRASGGFVPPRGLVRVNEQNPGVELLRLGSQGGTVIPLGQAAANRSSAAPIVHQHFALDMRGALTFPEFVSGIEQYVNGRAADAGGAAYTRAVRDAPVKAAQQRPLKS